MGDEVGVHTLLRTWRTEMTGMTQRQVRDRLAARSGAGDDSKRPVSPALFSMWESGKRRPSDADLQRLDDCYGADRALVGLCRALGTPDGLDPRTSWTFNVLGDPRPCWAWVRPAVPGRIDALVQWGAFKVVIGADCGREGVIVTAPISMPEPAAVFHLAQPGWVDAGDGMVPACLGIPLVDPVPLVEVATSGNSVAGLLDPRLARRMLADDHVLASVADFLRVSPDMMVEIAQRSENLHRAPEIRRPAEGAPRLTPYDGAGYRRLRKARGYSRAELSRRVTEMLPAARVTADQLDVFEAGGTPRVVRLPSRLDVALGGDGYTCIEPATVDRLSARHWRLHFPPYWIGPVWARFDAEGTASPAEIQIVWGGSFKWIRAEPGSVVRFRRTRLEPNPAGVNAPDGWTVTAGIGMRLDATNVTNDWRSAAPARLSQAHTSAHATFLGWFGRTPAEFDAAVDRWLGPGWRDEP